MPNIWHLTRRSGNFGNVVFHWIDDFSEEKDPCAVFWLPAAVETWINRQLSRSSRTEETFWTLCLKDVARLSVLLFSLDMENTIWLMFPSPHIKYLLCWIYVFREEEKWGDASLWYPGQEKYRNSFLLKVLLKWAHLFLPSFCALFVAALKDGEAACNPFLLSFT